MKLEFFAAEGSIWYFNAHLVFSGPMEYLKWLSIDLEGWAYEE